MTIPRPRKPSFERSLESGEGLAVGMADALPRGGLTPWEPVSSVGGLAITGYGVADRRVRVGLLSGVSPFCKHCATLLYRHAGSVASVISLNKGIYCSSE